MSSGEQSTYRRIIIGLCHGETDAQSIRTAAEFARLLGVNLHCLFIEDEALLMLAGMPFAREIRLPGHTWGALTAEAVEADIRHGAAVARRLMEEVMQDVSVRTEFKVSRGDPAECLAAICQSDDIMVVSEQRSPTLPPTHSRKRLGAVAYEGTRSILLLPSHLRHESGPVVAMPTHMGDLVLDAAGKLALNAKEDLLIVLPEALGTDARVSAMERAQAMGLTPGRVSFRATQGARMEHQLGALAGVQERLIIASRALLTSTEASDIATGRGTPLLLVKSKHPVTQETST